MSSSQRRGNGSVGRKSGGSIGRAHRQQGQPRKGILKPSSASPSRRAPAPRIGQDNDPEDVPPPEEDEERKVGPTADSRSRAFTSSKSFRKYANKQQAKRLRHSESEQCLVDGCAEYAPFSSLCLTHYLQNLQLLRRSVYGGGGGGGPAVPSANSPRKQAMSKSKRDLFSVDAMLGGKAKGLDRTEKRKRLCEEILSSEESYVQSLEVAVRYLRHLRAHHELGRAVVAPEQFNPIFSNIEPLLQLHRQLLGDLRQIQVDRKLGTAALGALFTRVSPFFRLYSTYVVNYESVPSALHKLREESPKFAHFLDHMALAEGGRALGPLLVAVVQRLPRYLLLLRGVEETSDGDKQRKSLDAVREALDAVTAVTQEVNEEFRRREARERVVTIQDLIADGITLVSPTRFHVHDGALRKRYAGSFHVRHSRMVYVFLCSDVMLYTTMPREGAKVRYRCSMALRNATVEALPPDPKARKGCEHGFALRGRPKDLTFYAASAEERDHWVRLFDERISVVKRNHSTLRLSEPDLSPRRISQKG